MVEAYSQDRRGSALIGPVLMASLLGGCSGGAPSMAVFGAYFPAWLLSACIGVLGALGARALIGAWRLDLPYLLFVCVAVGIIVGSLFWLLLYGR
jgi:hypothetical protein